EMHLDRLGRDEQRLGDLAVGEPVRGELADAAFAGGQGVRAVEAFPSRAGTGGAQLLAGVFGETVRAARPCHVEALRERLSRFLAVAGAAQCSSQVDESAGPLEPRG